MPAVSIITPLFNKGPFIKETIDSVTRQTLTDWEMIVVDDGSKDDGVRIVRDYSERDSRIHLVQREKATGPGSARNHALSLAKGQWILFLDADDLIESKHLESLLECAREHPAANLVVGCYQRFDDRNPDIKTLVVPYGNSPDKRADLNSAIAFGLWAPHAAVVKKSVVSGQFLWDEEDFFGEDTAFWFRLVSFHQPVFSESRGALYRYQSAQARTDTQSEKWCRGHHKQVLNNVAFLDRNHLSLTAGHCESLMRLYLEFFGYAVKRGDSATADWALAEAEKWLGEYFNHGANHSWKMRMRKMIGLARFEALKKRFRPAVS